MEISEMKKSVKKELLARVKQLSDGIDANDQANHEIGFMPGTDDPNLDELYDLVETIRDLESNHPAHAILKYFRDGMRSLIPTLTKWTFNDQEINEWLIMNLPAQESFPSFDALANAFLTDQDHSGQDQNNG